jgi:ribulose-phosphate 3-epimerase
MQKKVIPGGVQIAPSLLSADFSNLASEIKNVADNGVEILHLDVMDGHFVPNITFGPPLVKSIRNVTDLFLDTHLMISSPLDYIEPFARAGADLLTLHSESLSADTDGNPTVRGLTDLREMAKRLSDMSCGIGLTFKPATDPLPWLMEVGGILDLVLIMTVEPGFGGQSFMTGQVPRIELAAALKRDHRWRYALQVDGGINTETAPVALAAGAEILVAGNAVFGQTDRKRAIETLQC